MHTQVAIIGAGFGGLEAARHLSKSGVRVLLIDQHNYHCFQPLLYQVATAGLEPEQIAYPVRAIIRRWAGVEFLLARVTEINRASRSLNTSRGPVSYDQLIIAAGAITNSFGLEGVEQHGFGLKSLHDAERLRNHILASFEHAASEPDPVRRAALHTFVIVGGGPTGVEMAGALCELIRHVLTRDFPGLIEQEVRVLLLEASDSLLSAMPPRLRHKTLERLGHMGVEVRLNTALAHASPDTVTLSDGSSIAAHTLIWAAGVRGAPLGATLEQTLARGGRVPVRPDLRLLDDDSVWVIGDLAAIEGQNLPQVAPVAVQQGRCAARNLLALRAGQQPVPFQYHDQGSMATIGRNAAVAHIAGLTLTGFLAWIIWLVVHLMSLVGFRNRLVVLINWAYNYFFYERAVRLITGPTRLGQPQAMVQSGKDA